MYCKLALATLVVITGNEFATAQEVPSTTTAAELWNPWTWFWPYAIASAEGYRDYYQKAQKATNELYQLIEKTNAFPWITGNWGSTPNAKPQPNQNGEQGQNTEGEGGKQPNQEGQNTEGEGGKKPNQEGQNTESEAAKEPNKESENTEGEAGGQSNPAQDNQTDAGKPAQEETAQDGEKEEEKQNEAEGSGAQIQGSVQDDGKAEAEVKPN